ERGRLGEGAQGREDVLGDAQPGLEDQVLDGNGVAVALDVKVRKGDEQRSSAGGHGSALELTEVEIGERQASRGRPSGPALLEQAIGDDGRVKRAVVDAGGEDADDVDAVEAGGWMVEEADVGAGQRRDQAGDG